jgi:Intein splicing domain/LAGLIDADG-like domain/TraG P-loop domain
MRIKARRLAHRVTTAHLQAAYPFISEGGLGSDGVYIGRDVFGGSFCFCPWTLYGKEITGPNMLVIGQIGYAKSSLVKCLDEDTEVVDPVTGVPRTIAEVFKDEDVTRVLTLNQDRRIASVPIAAKVDVGLDSSCLRVTFASGRSVITTPEHPFLMPDGWRRADQLSVEETAAVPARIPFPDKPVRILDEEVDFLAIILAEGCYVRTQTGGVHFTSADPGIVARMREAGERLGFRVRHRGPYDWTLTGHVKFTEPPHGICACGCGAPTPIATRTRNGNIKGQRRRYADGHSSRRGAAATVLRRLGVPRALSRENVLPEIIYRLPPDQLARFIGVFWMCDGTVGKVGVSTTLASERLVRQLQHLLLRFGIQSGVRFHRSTSNGEPYPQWQLRVYSQSDQAFLSQILLWGQKRERLAALCAGRSGPVHANVGAPSLSRAMRTRLDAATRLPDGRFDNARLKQVAERLGASYRFQFSHIVNLATGRINRPGFRAFCEVFGLMDEYGWLLDSDVFWDRIVSIEDVGERHVYDLTVEPTACFVANDILVHNTYIWRQMLFGRTAWVIDPKGEYNQLAAFCGTEPIRFRSGGSLRLNPLDPMIGGDAQLALLRSISGVMLGRNLRPEEDACLERAHHEAVVEANNRNAQPTVPQVVNRLLEPSDATAHELRTSTVRLAEDGRQLALSLRRMGSGDLRGMFDGPTSSDFDLSSRLVVFNLREVKDEARPILMACTAAWLQGSWARSDGVRRIVVLDEAWVVLRHLAIARWLRESWKLARQYGVQNIAVMHRLSDLTAAGDAGSEQVQLAKGLLEDSETRVIYRQSPGEVEQARELLGLTQTECDQIPTLERGEALWRVGRRSFIVQHRIENSIEREIVDTDANMDPRSAPWAAQPRPDEAAEGAS